MTQRLIMDAIGGIDNKYILEAAQIKKNIPRKAIFPIAACLALILTAVAIGIHTAKKPPVLPPGGAVIWDTGAGDFDLGILEQAEAGKIVLTKNLLSAFEQSNDPSDIFAIQVIEVTGAAHEKIHAKFIQPLELVEEDYMASGIIFATEAQVAQMRCPPEFGFILGLAAKALEDEGTPTGGVISGRLANVLSGASDSDVFSVTLSLQDDIDLSAVDKLAMERANVTPEQLANPNSLEFHDRFNAERTAILTAHYQDLNNRFLLEAGLSNAEYDSVSLLLPYIRGLRLTKSQIIQLAANELVTGMYLTEDAFADDL